MRAWQVCATIGVFISTVIFFCGIMNIINNPHNQPGGVQFTILGIVSFFVTMIIAVVVMAIEERTHSTMQKSTESMQTNEPTFLQEDRKTRKRNTNDEIVVHEYTTGDVPYDWSSVMDTIEYHNQWAIVHDKKQHAWEVWMEGRLYSPCATRAEAIDLIRQLIDEETT